MTSRFTGAAAFIAVTLLSVVFPWKQGLAGEATSQPADQTPLKLFGEKQAWRFSNGPEFPGAKGTFQMAIDAGQRAGTIQYDFTDGGKYVAVTTDVEIPEGSAELRFKARSDKAQSLIFRIIDSEKQVHQYHRHYTSAGEWQAFRVPLNQPSTEHWHGSNDGVLRFPTLSLVLGVEGDKAKGSGNVLFSDVMLVK